MLPPYSIKLQNNGLFYNHQLAMDEISKIVRLSFYLEEQEVFYLKAQSKAQAQDYLFEQNMMVSQACIAIREFHQLFQ